MKGGSYDSSLQRFGTIAAGLLGDDLSSTARTIQYGAVPIGVPLNPDTSQRTEELVTTLTFEVIGVGDGVAEIFGLLLNADECQGDVCVFGPEVAVNLPEPGSVSLAVTSLLAIFGVLAVRRRALV